MSTLPEIVGSFTSSASGKQAVQSLAVELIIFCTTVAIAVVVKVFFGGSGCSASRWPSWRQRNPTAPDRTKNKIPDGVTDRCEQLPPTIQSKAPCAPERDVDGPRQVAAQGVPNIVDTIMDRTSLKNGNAEQALALYAKLRSEDQHLKIKDLTRQSKRHSVLDFFSALLQTAVRAGRPQLVDHFLDDMKNAGVERPLAFYESAMKVLSSKKYYQAALNVYDRLTADGLQASPVTLSCLINFSAELGEFDRAISFFEQLASTSTPSIRAYMTALRVHSKRQDWGRSLQILRSMQERSVCIDTLIVNTILATGVAAGKTESAEALLDEIATTDAKIVDVISYNTILKGYAHQKTADKALKILSRMLEQGVKANGITFNTVMDAAVRCSQVQDAWNVLEQMQSAGIQPDKYTCTILMKGLHEDSSPKQLSKVIDMMQLALPHCDSSLCSTLFRGVIQIATRLNNMTLLMRAFAHMREQHVQLASTDYQMLVQALAQNGHTSDCAVIWQSIMNNAVHGQQQDAKGAVVAIFIAVMEELSKREKVEGMLCAFESLSDAITSGCPVSDKNKGSRAALLLQQCRTALFDSASRKKDSSPAFRRLLELAPECGLSLEASMGK